MKKQSVLLIGTAFVVAVVILMFASALFFPLEQNELASNTLKIAEESFPQRIAGYKVQDSMYRYHNRSYIYQFRMADGENRYCAVSYYKHPLFARYRLVAYADYSHLGFSGILVAKGLPYEVVYDISGCTLEFKDAALNQHLMIGIGVLVAFMLLTAVIRSRRFFAAHKP